MSTTTTWGLDTIVTGITRTNTCTTYVGAKVLVINRNIFLVCEECPEGEGTSTLVMIDTSSGSPQKTTLANGSGYNRTNLVGLRVVFKDGTVIAGNGYGEAGGNAECGNNGDLWLVSGTTPHHLCSPYGNTAGGNIYNPLLDGQLGVILTGGTGAGWYIQKFDYTSFKYLDSWQVDDSSTGIWYDALLYDNDTDTYYLITSGKIHTAPNVKIYKVPADVIRNNWKSTTYLVNANGVELLIDTGYTIHDIRGAWVWNGKILLNVYDSSADTNKVITVDLSGNMDTLSLSGYADVLAGYHIVESDTTNNVLNIYDNQLNSEGQISFDFSTYKFVGNSGSDEWITSRYKPSDGSYDIIGFTCNGYIPYLEVDVTNNTISLKDFKTGQLLKGTLLYYETDVATGQIPPLGTPNTLSINGSTSIPSSTKKFIQFYVQYISGLAG